MSKNQSQNNKKVSPVLLSEKDVHNQLLTTLVQIVKKDKQEQLLVPLDELFLIKIICNFLCYNVYREGRGCIEYISQRQLHHNDKLIEPNINIIGSYKRETKLFTLKRKQPNKSKFYASQMYMVEYLKDKTECYPSHMLESFRFYF